MSKYKGFDSVELRKPERSNFDLSHEVKLSTRMGKLTPVLTMEVIPGDSVNLNTEIMARLAPMLAPVMHRVNIFIHHFYVPNRILANWWEAFITNGRLGTETPPVPSNAQIQTLLQLNSNVLAKGSLYDYMGGNPIPDSEQGGGAWVGRTIDLLPFVAYYKIWYDYYRDRNFVADNTILPMAAGTVAANLLELTSIKYRSWEHDYFTSALPWTQRGAAVLLPVSGTGNVSYLATSVVRQTGGGFPAANTALGNNDATGNLFVGKTAFAGTGGTGRIENIDTITFNNNTVTINDFRRAQRLQMWLERQALAGSRYNETIYAQFSVRTSDGRLQRAEYLGGGKMNIQISEVVAPNWSNDGTTNIPAGDLSGHGISYGNQAKANYFVQEHGFICSILSVMPRSAYFQGMPNMFRRRNTFLDYPWPLFGHLGEQPVYNHEIYGVPANVNTNRNNDTIFGYQSRYADWKFMLDRVSGDFRDTLNIWHLARTFSATPVLSANFNTFEDSLQNRIFAVSNVDTVWINMYNYVKVKRALPYYGTPML